MSIFNYKRRPSREVVIGNIGIGGNNPIRLQSMTNTDTNDTLASALQTINITQAGGEIVRLTTQGIREATNLGIIKNLLHEKNCQTPLVADVHFNPAAAIKAAETADKVRINPGNFTDAPRTFKKLSFSDEEYTEEIKKIDRALAPLIETCKKHNTALRLGVNHGSLSDRIMSRFGDTPAGMTESVMEYLRACQRLSFHNIVISIKASNPVVMTATVRLLSQTMQHEGMDYPLHLGVTEAGNGEDGRIKSAVGIGSLLAEGLGDTIRVSLSEPPENEIPIAQLLRDYISARTNHPHITEPTTQLSSPDNPDRLKSKPLHGYNGKIPAVIGLDNLPQYNNWDSFDAASNFTPTSHNIPVILHSNHINAPAQIAASIELMRQKGFSNPVIIKLSYSDTSYQQLTVKAAADFGFLLLNGYGSAIWIDAPQFSVQQINNLALGILQATRLRISKTDYIACPGCGRTLFNLENTLAEIRKATNHLTHLKIAVMGCIVNGPGEMADADYGYVGAGPGRVSLYKNKELILKNIPTTQAVDQLINIIKKNNDWVDP